MIIVRFMMASSGHLECKIQNEKCKQQPEGMIYNMADGHSSILHFAFCTLHFSLALPPRRPHSFGARCTLNSMESLKYPSGSGGNGLDERIARIFALTWASSQAPAQPTRTVWKVQTTWTGGMTLYKYAVEVGERVKEMS